MKLYRSLSSALLFIVLMVMPGLAGAASYLYTYTGSIISSTDPNLDWKYMDNPDNNRIMVQFIYDSDYITWSFSEQSVRDFTVSLGSVRLSYNGLMGTDSNASLHFYNTNYSTQLPTAWFVSMKTIVPGSSESYGLLLQTSLALYDTADYQYINEWRCNYYYDPAEGGPVNNQSLSINLTPGVWKRVDTATVPLPAPVILLGSGLAGLAAMRRRKLKDA